jgi:hypothetical protein
MARILRRVLHKTDAHLSDEQILAAIDGDSPAQLPARAVRHLESCWRCLARRQQLQDTIVRVVDYQRELVAPFLPPPVGGEDRFIARLDRQIQTADQERRSGFASLFRSFGLLYPNPAVTSAVAGLLVLTAFLVFWVRNIPSVSASEFLERAKVWSESPKNGEQGVIYQRVRVRTIQHTMERAVYLDVERRRRLKGHEPTEQEQELKKVATDAGVSWDEPLSAIDFQNWHNGLEQKEDQVTPSGANLLTLTTRVGQGSIAAESLTVRKTDFHPVARSVHFRNTQTLDITELDYGLLSWSAVSDSIFVPLPSDAPAPPHAPSVASLPTDQELDEAELKVRLALTRLNADSEQLELSRSSRRVTINGVVETRERKNSLLNELHGIPNVVCSISSVDELTDLHALKPPSIASVREFSDVAGPSPLEEFFRSHGKTQGEVSSVSRQLLDAAVTIQQEGSALDELSKRFGVNATLSREGQATLGELLDIQSKKLFVSLDAEALAVRSINLPEAVAPDVPTDIDSTKSESLTAAAVHNKALCTELISGVQSSPRPVPAITSDLLHSIREVRRLAAMRSAPAQD